MEIKSSPVLVTGATGFVASHLIKLLLEKDFKVRGTVRSLANKSKYQFLYNLVPSKSGNLTLVEAELTDKPSWSAAVEGCQYIFHVASPFPAETPKDENELIVPAVEGTLNVLEAALAKGAKKVVVTSSVATIFIGNAGTLFNEDHWSNEAYLQGYAKSKVVAEKAAWKFYEEHKNQIQVSVVNPVGVFGPVFTKQGGTSEAIVSDMLTGDFPGILDLELALVDVRDVAECHYRTMFNEKVNGQRVICSAGDVPVKDMLGHLKNKFGKYGYEVQDKPVTVEEANNSKSKVAQQLTPLVGMNMKLDNKRSVEVLGMKYLPVDKTLVDMGCSLIHYGIVDNKTNIRINV